MKKLEGKLIVNLNGKGEGRRQGVRVRDLDRKSARLSSGTVWGLATASGCLGKYELGKVKERWDGPISPGQDQSWNWSFSSLRSTREDGQSPMSRPPLPFSSACPAYPYR